MNFRVALQYEFTNLGLDECLDNLRNHESDELSVQVCTITKLVFCLVLGKAKKRIYNEFFGSAKVAGLRHLNSLTKKKRTHT